MTKIPENLLRNRGLLLLQILPAYMWLATIAWLFVAAQQYQNILIAFLLSFWYRFDKHFISRYRKSGKIDARKQIRASGKNEDNSSCDSDIDAGSTDSSCSATCIDGKNDAKAIRARGNANVPRRKTDGSQYLNLPVSELMSEKSKIKKELLSIQTAMKAISPQQEFSKWARLQREFTRVKDNFDDIQQVYSQKIASVESGLKRFLKIFFFLAPWILFFSLRGHTLMQLPIFLPTSWTFPVVYPIRSTLSKVATMTTRDPQNPTFLGKLAFRALDSGPRFPIRPGKEDISASMPSVFSSVLGTAPSVTHFLLVWTLPAYTWFTFNRRVAGLLFKCFKSS